MRSENRAREKILNCAFITSYERDEETNLDFAQARYFNFGVGRFSSPDSFLNDTYTQDPGSWNRYIYVRNNPLRFVDPSGEEIWIVFSEIETVTNADGSTRERRVSRSLQYKGNKLYDDKGKEYTGNNDYANKVLKDLNQLKEDSSTTKRKIEDLEKSSFNNNIMMTTSKSGGFNTTEGAPSEDTRNGKGANSTIYYDPDARKTAEGGDRTPRVGLAHEISHAWDNDRGQSERTIGESGVETREVRAIRLENEIRAKTGDPIRTSYGGTKISLNELNGIPKNTEDRSWSPDGIKRVRIGPNP